MFKQMINMIFMSIYRAFKSLNQAMGMVDEATGAGEDAARDWRKALEQDRARRFELMVAERTAAIDLREATGKKPGLILNSSGDLA